MKKFYLPIIAILLCLNSLPSFSAESHPPLSLDSKSPHLMIWTDGWIPEINFYATSTLKGEPSFRLDVEGLHHQKKMLCHWPGGRFDSKKTYNMVLGYGDLEAGKYEGCGEGGPILSTWGDGGTGTAVLYIRVKKKSGSLITADFQTKEYFFDLKTIPENNWSWLEAGNDFTTHGE